MCDEDVFITVSIVVRDGDTHAGLRFTISAVSTAGKQGMVVKSGVALIDPELIGGLVVGDVDVEPAVTVEISGHDAESVAETQPRFPLRG